jgi:transposase
MPYSSDLTDAEWAIFEPLLLEILPTKKQTRPSNWTKREIFNGILYQLKNGCNWCDLQARLSTLLHCLLALQAVANSRSVRATDGGLA